jgi:sec-independent protein translocase protein TatB
MNFLGIGGMEMLVIGLIAFLLLGPKGMADGAKTVNKFMKDLRGQRDELQKIVKSAVEEEQEEDRAKKAPPVPSGAVARPAGARPDAQAAAGQPTSSVTAPTASTESQQKPLDGGKT